MCRSRSRTAVVTGQDLRPVLHRLVCGQDGGASKIAVRYKPEEETGFFSVHDLVPDLADDEKLGRHVLLSFQGLRRRVSVLLHQPKQVTQPVEGDSEAVVQGLDSEAHGEVSLANPGGPWSSTVELSRMY